MVQRNTEQQLRLPAELHDVPEGVLKVLLGMLRQPAGYGH